jgi:hypothetical protein
MQVSRLLTTFAALYLVVALQVGGIKNDTSPVQGNVSSKETPMPNGNTNFWFSLAGAIGSLATAAAFGFIIYQTRLTKKQLAQTQEEIDNTLRAWIGVLQTTGKDIEFSEIYVESAREYNPKAKITAKYFLKNFGRIPARIVSKRYKWSKEEISEDDLYSVEIPAEWSSSRLRPMIFPDEDARNSADSSELSFLDSPGEIFYFGLLIEYDSGEGTKKRELGSIFKCVQPAPICLKIWTDSGKKN